MDWTSVMIAGIGVTGTLIAPIVGERLRRNSARDDRLMDARVTTYAELLEISGRVVDNAMTWAAIPAADLHEPDESVMQSALARVRTVGSREVRRRTEEFGRLASKFYRGLDAARMAHKRVEDSGDVDSPEAIGSRMQLGTIADELRAANEGLESAVRRDLRSG